MRVVAQNTADICKAGATSEEVRLRCIRSGIGHLAVTLLLFRGGAIASASAASFFCRLTNGFT